MTDASRFVLDASRQPPGIDAANAGAANVGAVCVV